LENDLKGRIIYLEKRIKDLEFRPIKTGGTGQTDPMKILTEIVDSSDIEKRYMEILIDKILIDSHGNPTIYMKVDFEALCSHSREDANLVPDQ
jgi:hypothetical protein